MGPVHVVPYIAFVCGCPLPNTIETEDLKPRIDLFSSLYMTGRVRGWSPQQVEGSEGGEQVRGRGDGDSAQISTGENPANPQQTTHHHTAGSRAAQQGDNLRPDEWSNTAPLPPPVQK